MSANNTNNTEQGYKVIATKVSPEAAVMLDELCKRLDTNIYTMLQQMCRVFVKLMSDSAPMSADTAQIIRMFDGVTNWQQRFNICDPSVHKAVDSAIYILSAKGKHGFEGLLVDRPYFGNSNETYNMQQVLEMFLCKLMPDTYRRLRLLGADLECTCVYETLDKVIDLQQTDPNERVIQELFADNDRSEFGSKPNSSQYRRKMHKTPDSPGLFDDTPPASI